MTKKFLITLFVLFGALFVSTYVFANNDMEKAGDAIKGAVGNAENAIENTAGHTSDAIKNGANNVGSAVNNTMHHAENTISNASNSNNNYHATRTNTNTNLLGGMNSTMFIWLVMGICTLAIIGLIWYYGSQRENYTIDND